MRQSTEQIEQQAKEKLEKQRSVKPIPITIYLGRNGRMGGLGRGIYLREVTEAAAYITFDGV